ncbi:MAG: SufE family protein [Tolumonas sp.]|jgi:cysteine desulfuration protein SufE|uniref:Fe-S metabolism associated SufE n=1 Tax=Tolumonas auensis (strain DSM 9187 / NBRC 110442 / TA 4) TaxID=595494 RepID=C4L8M9_TOLAT|nr:SufE family protein [Tolumonas auensis]ACQ91899.1 Fe-S metabolism associated SufE [Tolumonas auensis DSM 9187]MBP7980177.1 SufE family protein [Tolumonas sp.]
MTELFDFTVHFPVGAGTALDENHVRQLLADANSWEERYRQLLLLAKQVPSVPQLWRHPDHEVGGCESRVWLLLCRDDAGKYHFAVDSESRIVKALLITILAAANHQTADKIHRIQVASYLAELGFAQHITLSRTNGLQAVWKKMSDFCASFA